MGTQVTAGDASDAPAPRVSASLLKLATGKPDRGAGRPRSLLHKLAHAPGLPPSPLLAGFRSSTAEEGGGGAGAGAGAGSAPTSARSSRAGEEDADLGGELEEGQLLRLTIALSQVASIERQERRIKASPRGPWQRPSCLLWGMPCCLTALNSRIGTHLVSCWPPTAGLLPTPEAAAQHRVQRRLEGSDEGACGGWGGVGWTWLGAWAPGWVSSPPGWPVEATVAVCS